MGNGFKIIGIMIWLKVEERDLNNMWSEKKNYGEKN